MCADYEQVKARAREVYWQRRNEGVCVQCGKRFADAGYCMCRPCWKSYLSNRERTDPGGKKHLAWLNERNRERREAGLCVDCGRKLIDKRFSRCKSCRNRRADYQQVKRMRERIRKEQRGVNDVRR